MSHIAIRMLNAGVEHLGDLNPQLLREIQGRLRLRNVLLTVVSALIGQGLFWLMSFRSLNFSTGYCHLLDRKGQPQNCFQFGDSYTFVDWHHWWFQTFGWECWIILLFAVGAGSFLLISDLSKEERRGTLTFLSLSPQPAKTILLGKMLGVPILVYLAIAVVLPFHYYFGIMAEVPVIGIVVYDVSMLIACSFFYSAALLIGLAGQWLNGFQAWLGSAGFLGLLQLSTVQTLASNSWDWFYVFFPSTLIAYLGDGSYQSSFVSRPFFFFPKLSRLKYFSISVGESGSLLFILMSLNCLLWTFLIWQALKRRYQNPAASLLSKKQSYLATLSFTTCHLGFAISYQFLEEGTPLSIIFLHVIWFLLLIVLLTPQHQPFLDWARTHRGSLTNARNRYVHDLLWGDNSPIWGAIALNLMFATSPAIVVMFWKVGGASQISALSLILTAMLLLVVTLYNQLRLFKPVSHQAWWTIATLLGPIVIPSLLLAIAGFEPDQGGAALFLLTPFSFLLQNSVSPLTWGLACVLYLSAIAGLLMWFNRQVKRYGESETKRLLQEVTS